MGGGGGALGAHGLSCLEDGNKRISSSCFSTPNSGEPPQATEPNLFAARCPRCDRDWGGSRAPLNKVHCHPMRGASLCQMQATLNAAAPFHRQTTTTRHPCSPWMDITPADLWPAPKRCRSHAEGMHARTDTTYAGRPGPGPLSPVAQPSNPNAHPPTVRFLLIRCRAPMEGRSMQTCRQTLGVQGPVSRSSLLGTHFLCIKNSPSTLQCRNPWRRNAPSSWSLWSARLPELGPLPSLASGVKTLTALVILT